MAFVPGSHLLVVTDWDGFLSLADADSGRVLWRERAHDAVDQHAGRQRRRPAARHRKPGQHRALLVAARRPSARTAADLPAHSRPTCSSVPTAAWSRSRCSAGSSSGTRAPGAGCAAVDDEGRRRHGALLAQRPADRALQLRPAHRCGPRATGRRSRACSPDTPGRSPGTRSAATTARWSPAASTAPIRLWDIESDQAVGDAARRARAHRHRPAGTRRRPDRRLRHRSRVPLGHPPRLTHPPSVPDRRSHTHARRVGRVPARPRLRTGLHPMTPPDTQIVKARPVHPRSPREHNIPG